MKNGYRMSLFTAVSAIHTGCKAKNIKKSNKPFTFRKNLLNLREITNRTVLFVKSLLHYDWGRQNSNDRF